MDERTSIRTAWPWLLGILLLVLLFWAVAGVLGGGRGDVEVKESVPAAG